MLKLSGFADEIGPDIDEQIAVCKRLGVTHFELRGVANTNVLSFGYKLRREVKDKLADAGLGVVSIGSPCGKMPIDAPREELLEQFRRAIDAACYFDAPLIRVFSYYPEGGEGKGPIEPIRDRVVDLFREQCELLKDVEPVMAHENERGIYGDIGSRCVDLMKTIDHPKLRTAFDFANFVQAGQDPLAIWPELEPYTVHIHIKDAIAGSGKVVPAGQGDGKIAEILKDAYAAGYRGFLTLEPHLKVAGHSHGETGPELFEVAVTALRDLCRGIDVPLAS